MSLSKDQYGSEVGKTSVLHEDQQKAVFCTKNTVLVAGAGSGKTTVLAYRVVRILIDSATSIVKDSTDNSHSVGIEGILCLTFTKKATAEMTERIHHVLATCVAHEHFEGRTLTIQELDYLRIQLAHFSNAQIMTLDSFSLKIAMIGLNRFGFVQKPTLVDRNSYRNYIIPFVLRWLFDSTHANSPLHNLVQRYKFSKILESFFVPLLSDAPCISVDMQSMIDTIYNKNLSGFFDTLGKCLEQSASDILDILSFAFPVESTTDISNSIKALFADLHALQRMLLNKDMAHIDLKFSLRGVTVNAQIKKLDEETKQNFLHLIGEIKSNIVTYNLIIETYKQKDHYYEYYTSLQGLLEDWNTYRQEQGIYTYSNIVEISSHTLENYPDIQSWYSKRYKHIIIDEFQDNNVLQRELLFLLSDNTRVASDEIIEQEKYFFVGDPKQSIYSFRGADVRAFTSLKSVLKDSIEEISMSNNYRSKPNLISLFNTWFEKFFADKDINGASRSVETEWSADLNSGVDEHADVVSRPPIESNSNISTNNSFSRIAYTPQNSPLEKSCDSELYGILSEEEIAVALAKSVRGSQKILSQDFVCLFDIIHQQKEESPSRYHKKDIEGYAIARRIQTMRANGILVQDIAVLSRTKAIFPYIIKYLLMQDIQYNVVNSEMSIRQDVGKDFYSWLKLLVYPEDRSAYAAVLRSPLLNISDDMVIGLLALQRRSTIEGLFNFDAIVEEVSNAFTEHSYIQKKSVQEHLSIQENIEYRKKIIAQISRYTEEIHALACVKQKYAEARAMLVQGKDALAILQHFWLDCGYRYVLLRDKKYHVFLSHYNLLKSLLTAHKTDGIQVLLEMLKTIISEAGTQLEMNSISSETNEGVTLMTIHASKGLEFPYVILADMDSSYSHSRGGDADLCVRDGSMLYIDFGVETDEMYLLGMVENENAKEGVAGVLSSNSGVDKRTIFSTLIKRKKEESELLRLLYVACTRAKNVLVISGYMPTQKKDGSVKKTYMGKMFYEYGFFDFDENDENDPDISSSMALQADENNGIRYTFTLYKNSEEIQSEIERQRRAGEAWGAENRESIFNSYDQVSTLAAQDVHRIEVSPSSGTRSITEEQKEKLNRLLVDGILEKYAMSTAFGTYCHFLLSYYCRGMRANVVPVKLESQLLPLRPDEKKLFIDEAEKLCRNFLESELWLKKSKSKTIYTEYPFLMWDETHRIWVRGIIDLLIIDEKGACTIIDYKVDRYKKHQQYQYQMETYKMAVQKLFTRDAQDEKFVEVYLVYLRNTEFHLHDLEITEKELIAHLLGSADTIEEEQCITITEEYNSEY